MDITIGTPRRLGHLPLVADVLRRTGLLSLLDKAIVDDRRSKVSTSECVTLIMCAVYIGDHGLWRMRERLAPYDMCTIMRDPGFDLSAFPEERLAKALDDLAHFGLDKLMTAVAVQMIEQFHLNTDFLHFDTTSLSFYGAYEREDFESMSPDMPPGPRVTYGYAKNKRSDLKQIMFGTLVSADGGVPVFGRALDGNMSDNESSADFFARVRSLVHDPRAVVCVADSKGWCGRVLRLIDSQKMRLLSRMPRTQGLHAEVMAKPWHPTGTMTIPARSKQDPPDHYEFSGCDAEQEFTVEETGPDGNPVAITFTIAVRAVRVFSSALLRQKVATLERIRKREATMAKGKIRSWQARAYACADDAERAAARHAIDHGFISLDLQPLVTAVAGPFKPGRGRPRKNPEPDLPRSHYRITYTTSPVSTEISTERLRNSAHFILVRNRQEGWMIADSELITRYKGQYHNEHGFSWLKSTAGLNPVFLETPHRIASLCFLYTIGLMIWNLIQRTVRMYLKNAKAGLPYHRNKPSDHITTKFLFELFPSVQTIPLTLPDGTRQNQLAGMEKWQELACRALGVSRQAFHPVVENRA